MFRMLQCWLGTQRLLLPVSNITLNIWGGVPMPTSPKYWAFMTSFSIMSVLPAGYNFRSIINNQKVIPNNFVRSIHLYEGESSYISRPWNALTFEGSRSRLFAVSSTLSIPSPSKADLFSFKSWISLLKMWKLLPHAQIQPYFQESD